MSQAIPIKHARLPHVIPTRSVWISDRVFDAARILLICGIYAAVWGIGGHFPIARFVTLALLAVATALTLVSNSESNPHSPTTTSILWVIFATLAYGLLQIAPFDFGGLLDWSGVRATQVQFGAIETGAAASQSQMPLTQSLVPWKTQAWLAMAVIGLTSFFLGSVLFRDNHSRNILLWSLMICGVGQVLWGVVQFTARPDEIFIGVPNPSDNSIPFGTFLNRNHAADFIALTLGCAIGLCRMRMMDHERTVQCGYGQSNRLHHILSEPLTLAAWLCLICLVAGVLLTVSRGGCGATLIAITIVAVVWKRKGKKRRIGLAIGAFSTMALTYVALQFFGLGDRVTSRADSLELETVMSDSRFSHWSDAMPAVQHFFPLGSGQGTYGEAYLSFDPQPSGKWFTHAHNQYLETAMEMGVFGIVMVAAALFLAIKCCAALCSSDRSDSKQALGLAALMAVLLHAFHAMTDFGLMMPGNLIALAVLVGAASSISQPEKNSRRSGTKRTLSIAANDATCKSSRWSHLLAPVSTVAINLVVLFTSCAALWQQGRHVRASQVAFQTDVNSSTPSPTITSTDARIARVEKEISRWPLYEPLWRRKIRLHLHRTRRAMYDQIRQEQGNSAQVDPVTFWNATSLESIIARLYDQTNQVDQETKRGIQQTLDAEQDLVAAREDLQVAIELNVCQPRTHFLTALLDACTGHDWQKSFDRSVKLSTGNPSHFFDNGLLAWASNDEETMIAQWRKNLATETDSIDQIYALASLRLSEEEMVHQLMPGNWLPPYLLAQKLTDVQGKEQLREQLLSFASDHAHKTLSDPVDLHKTLGRIATASGELSLASEHYEQAIQNDPRDARLRYLAAIALYRSGNAKHAVDQARVATMLDPANADYRNLLFRVTRLHRQAYSQ